MPENLQQADTLHEHCDYCDLAAIAECKACHKNFCSVHQSHQSLFHCVDCYNSIIVQNKIIHKTLTKYSVKEDKVITRIKSCKQISFDGEAWRKQTALIHTLPDQELYEMLELHRASISLLSDEILQRNIKAARASVLASYKPKTPGQPKPVVKVHKAKEITKDSLNSAIKKAKISADTIKAMLAKLQGA